MGRTTLAFEKFPQGPADDWAYRLLCLVVVVGSFWLLCWAAGWLWRHL
jgi:hypothetical protein